MENNEKKQEQGQLQLELPQDVAQGEYANFAIISHSSSDFVIDFAERLNPNIVIERFAGEVPPRYLVSEPWMKLRYDEVLNRIEKRMEERGTWQGRLYQ